MGDKGIGVVPCLTQKLMDVFFHLLSALGFAMSKQIGQVLPLQFNHRPEGPLLTCQHKTRQSVKQHVLPFWG